MKKTLALALTVLMVFMLAACKKKAPVAVDGIVEEPSPFTDFRIGVIHTGDPIIGHGYSYAHDMGIVAMQQALGLSDEQIVRKSKVSDTDSQAIHKAVEDCIDKGCKIIFGTSQGYGSVLAELAKKHPDVIFSSLGTLKSSAKNFNSYFGRLYQACYLSGIAAGLRTESGMIGYVAALGSESSDVTSCADAFAMGVESVAPHAKIYLKVTGKLADPYLERQAADELMDIGCDVIAQYSDTAFPLITAELRGVWGCGHNIGITNEFQNAYLTAPLWNWGVYYTKATKAAIEGNWSGENYCGGMSDGFVDISRLSGNCTEGTKEAVDAAKAEILNGHDIFVGELIDNEGNTVCAEDESLDDTVIFGGIHWYYRNIEVL